MPPRRRHADLFLDDAKAYCRRFRLRVGDASQVAKLLEHLRHLNKVLIQPDGSLPQFVSYHHRVLTPGDDAYTPEWVQGRPVLLFEGTLAPHAGERNDIARHMHALLDPEGDRAFWHGPVTITA
ncbi:hypothetical protein [Streptomyces sp. NPDC059003]|uniref:hypothetical protein n=1 Tax=Streptomyces sp. NPDC059003 TaxID=3346691 RepID=UPI0036BF77E1